MIAKGKMVVDDLLIASAVKNSDAYVIISNAQDEIIWINEGLEKRSGYALNKITGLQIGDVFRGKETNTEISNHLDRARKNGRGYSCEILTYTKQKEEFWLQLSTNPFHFEGQSYFVTIATEITELKKTQEDLVRANQRIKALIDQKDEVLSALTHDLKAPLTSIIGLLELFDKENLSPDQNKYLDMLSMSSHTMKNLVANILELGQRNSQKNTINKEPCDLESLFRDVVGQFKIMAEMSGNIISLDFDPLLKGSFYTDGLKLSRVFSNLIGNAIKFTENGTVTVTCEDASDKNSSPEVHNILIKVEDTGTGISKEAQEKIFNRYEQEDDEIISKYGGTGLGLSICKKIVQDLDGSIELESEVGIGTTFTLRFKFNRA